MNEWVCIAFNGFNAVVLGTIGTTMLTFAVHPIVCASQVTQIALHVTESCADTVLAVGLLGAVEGAAAHLGGEVGAGDAENLLGHNVVDALLQIGDLLFETRQQPLGDLAQEDAALRAGVEEARPGAAEELLRQQVEHTVGQLGRGEDLVAAEVGQTVQYVR